jgi:hypothetical protein
MERTIRENITRRLKEENRREQKRRKEKKNKKRKEKKRRKEKEKELETFLPLKKRLSKRSTHNGGTKNVCSKTQTQKKTPKKQLRLAGGYFSNVAFL